MKKTITNFKMLLLTAILLLGSINVWGQKQYQLITDASQLEVNANYLFVGIKSGTYWAMGYQNTNNRPGVTVSAPIGNIITTTIATASSEQVKPYEITLKGSSGAWNLYDPINNTYLRPRTGDNNGLQGNSATANWTISIASSGVATITCTGTFNRPVMQVNPNNPNDPLFACYASANQTAVYLYKEVATTPTVATPTFSPAGGTYTAAQNVTISSTTPSATIYYTTDGTTPSSSSAVYTSPIAVGAGTTTIKAIAEQAGMNASAVATATYTLTLTPTITASTMTLSFTGVEVGSYEDDMINVTGANLSANISANITGTNAAFFEVGVNQIAPAGDVLVITYRPTVAGSHTATLTLTSTGAIPISVALSGTSVIPSNSIVCNGSFELWTAGKPDCWFGSKTTVAAGNVKQYTTSVQDGSSAVQLTRNATGHQRFTSQTVSVTAGTTYNISFWVRGQGDIRTGLFDDRATNSGYSDYNAYINVNSTSWAHYTQTIAATHTTSIAEFIFSVANTVAGKDHLQIDNVVITPVVPTLAATPSSLNFGNISVGSTSAPQSISVSGADLTANINYAKSGVGAAAFSITQTSWNAATGGTLSVTFNPTVAQAYSAQITISSTGAQDTIITLSGTGLAIPTYTITASAVANGSITPSGAVAVVPGASQAFTITPNTGYEIATVLIDGVNNAAEIGRASCRERV